MSYKNNLIDPTRRARLMARRIGRIGHGLKVEDERDKYGHLVLKRERFAHPPAYVNVGTPMKISNRNAMWIYAKKVLPPEQLTVGLRQAIMGGYVSRKTIYGKR